MSGPCRLLRTAAACLLLVSALVACGGASSSAVSESKEVAVSPDRFLLGGIQINEPSMEEWLDTLIDSGFNTVSLTVYARQGRWDSAEIEEKAEADWVVPEIRAAKERGLAVVLILRVALEHALEENRFLWHGMIMPHSDEELANWFERYGAFVRRWAEVARDEGVDVLGIGSELNALASTRTLEQLPPLEEYYLDPEKQQREHLRTLRAAGELPPDSLDGQLKAGWGATYERLDHFLDDRSRAHREWALQVTSGGDVEEYNRRKTLLSRHWHDLIADVRSIYSGDLTYAANFDQYLFVDFWDELDLIGVNAYFPLRRDVEDSEPSELAERFRASWRQILEEIDQNRRALDAPVTPVVFTELGYTRRRGATVEPWAGDGFGVVGDPEDAEMLLWRRREIDPRERALAVRSLGDAALDHPGLLHGLLYWKLSTVPEHEEIEPFVLILGQEDPLEEELRTLARRLATAEEGETR